MKLIRSKPGQLFLGLLTMVFVTSCINKDETKSDFNRNISFNENWKFIRADIEHAEVLNLNDSRWRAVDLPHDISMEDLPIQDSIHIGPFSKEVERGEDVGFFTGGTAWYQKHLMLEPGDTNKQFVLNFDGVQSYATVYVNGKNALEHYNGYVPFNVNITPFLNHDNAKNIIAVKVVNPEVNSRWFAGFGIYRNVSLSILNPIHIKNWGVAITTPEILENSATVNVSIDVENNIKTKEDILLRVEIIDQEKNTVKLEQKRLSNIEVGETNVQFHVKVDNPQLWDIDAPYLYGVKVAIKSKQKTLDAYETKFGIRSIDFSAAEGFQLNGKTVLLKGACMHHDNGILGAAAFKQAEYRKVKIMKQNGYNAIRTSHNPPSKYFLNACDELGMLVIDEFFDMWEVAKRKNDYHKYFKEYWEKDVEAIMYRDRNHPSIILWSYGNEINERASPRGIKIAHLLVEKIKSIDTSRPTTQAICKFWDHEDQIWEEDSPAAFEVMDVAGYNYASDKYESDHELYPERIMYGSESYPHESFKYWEMVEKLPYVIGDFVWTGMDYLGEAGIGRSIYKEDNVEEWIWLPGWPWYVSNCGDIDILGNKKPSSLYRDVVWRISEMEILVHEPVPPGKIEHLSYWGWPKEQPHWNWEGNEGALLNVSVYNRCHHVKLLLNGKEIGIVPTDSTNLTAAFEVPYSAGKLVAIGLKNGEPVCKKTLTTTGTPYQLVVTAEQDNLTNQTELVYFNVEVHDKKGLIVPDAEVSVDFELEGDATLLAVGNGNPKELSSFKQPKSNTIKGRCQFIARTSKNAKQISLKATSKGLNEVKCMVTAIK